MTPIKKRKYVFDQASISKIRNQLHLTQEKFAQELGVTKTAISRWELGKVKPDLDSLSAIYSLAVENHIEPDFFMLKEIEMKQGRSRLIGFWDFQNQGWTFLNANQKGSSIKDLLQQTFPTTHSYLLKVFASSFQSHAISELSKFGWRPQIFNSNIDKELDSQAWSDCNQEPQDTIFVLIASDGDYIDLIQSLRTKGVWVYLMAPRNVNHRLLEAVGVKYYIPFDNWWP